MNLAVMNVVASVLGPLASTLEMATQLVGWAAAIATLVFLISWLFGSTCLLDWDDEEEDDDLGPDFWPFFYNCTTYRWWGSKTTV